MRQNNSILRFPVVILLAVVVWTGWIYERLPQVMVTHWDFLGNANGWMDKVTGAWLIPMIMLLLWALWEIMPASDKRHCRSKAFLEPYWQFNHLMLVLMAGLQWGVAQVNIDANFPLVRFLGWILVLFMAWLGRLLPSMPPNLVMGVRTRWTLSSSRIWRATHVETARGLRSMALLSIIFQVVLPNPWNLVSILASLVGVLLWGVVFSFVNRE